MDEIHIPINIMKEKILYCLPENAEIDDEAIKVLSNSVNLFFKELSHKIIFDKDNNKIKIKDIKICLEADKKFNFLQKLK